MWPLSHSGERGQEPAGLLAEETVMNRPLQEQATTSTRLAPWWLYLVIIVGANHLRRAVVADWGGTAVRVVVALAFAAALFIIITVIYRANVRHAGSYSRRR
jgi:hypothetical protein